MQSAASLPLPPSVPAPASAAPRTTVAGRGAWWKCAVVLVVLTLLVGAAYTNSLTVPFLFDDHLAIVESPRVRSPAWRQVLHGTTRPVLYASLAANYQFGGLDVRGYHVVNGLIHLAAGVVLFGLLLQLLRTPTLQWLPPAEVPWLAGLVTALWLVHPLQTQAVTYIVQRGESLVGFFYLLCLYGVVRGALAQSTTAAWIWYGVAIVANLLGMGTKELMVTAPLAVLLVDRGLLANSWSELIRRRWGLYIGLSLGWPWLAYLIVTTPNITEAGGFNFAGVSPWQYFRSQPLVLWQYLRLSFWPTPLCFDYLWPVTHSTWDIIVPGLGILALLGLSLFALWRVPAAGVAGLLFFLLLAPTSTINPIADLAVEHRLYLSLAPLLGVVLIGLRALLPRAAGWPVRVLFYSAGTILVLLAARATFTRNIDYASEVSLWQTVVQARPQNARAYENLGVALQQVKRADEARAAFLTGLQLRPDRAQWYNHLGLLEADAGRWNEAIVLYRQALQLQPQYATAYANLGNAHLQLQQFAAAEENYERARALDRNLYLVDQMLGTLYLRQGKLEPAVQQFQKVLAERPEFAPAHCSLGSAYLVLGKPELALAELQTALRLQPNYAEAHYNLAALLASTARTSEQWQQVIRHDELAIAARPDYLEPHYHLGNLYYLQKQLGPAEQYFRRATQLAPNNPFAHANLGIVLVELNRVPEAVQEFRAALRLKPDWVDTGYELGWILAAHPDEQLRSGADAVALAEGLSRGAGSRDPRTWDLLAAAYAETGQFDLALKTATQAINLAVDVGDEDLAREILARRNLYYQLGQPVRIDPALQRRRGGGS